MSAWNFDGAASGGIARVAMNRLASALITEDDTFEEAIEVCTLEAVVTRLSERDRIVLASISKRVAEIEAERGSDEAELALNRVLAILAADRNNV
jgi:hypothetical protein